jgi:hypothetical protein
VAETVESVHEQLFGFVPAKHGDAYERLAAVVLAILGWRDVQQQFPEQPQGRLAKQKLDVVAFDPTGEQRRLIVECKHVGEDVGKGVMDRLVGIRAQLGADTLAVITTKKFTRGARTVAADERIAMIELRPYDPVLDRGAFVLRIEVTLVAQAPPEISNVGVELGETRDLSEETQVSLTTSTRLRRDDGTEAEMLHEVLEVDTMRPETGEFDRRKELTERRWLPAGGGLVELKALTWHEKVVSSLGDTTIIEKEGKPVLVLHEVGVDGKPVSGRLVVDNDLNAWDLDEDNRVVPRGPLLVEP